MRSYEPSKANLGPGSAVGKKGQKKLASLADFFHFSSSAEPGPRLSEANVAFCAKRGEEKNNASHLFRALRKMPRSPRLAHKAPVHMRAMDDHVRVNLERTQRVLILAL